MPKGFHRWGRNIDVIVIFDNASDRVRLIIVLKIGRISAVHFLTCIARD